MSSEKNQLNRVKEAASKLGADEAHDAWDKGFGKLDMKRKPEGEKPENTK